MRVEMIECDLHRCNKSAPNPTDGYITAAFDGRVYDFCSAAHQAKWEDELRKMDPDRKASRAKGKR